MTVSKNQDPVQLLRGEDSVRNKSPRGDHGEMSHVAMAALALAVVVIAGLSLLYVSRQSHEHPGAVLAVIVGIPVLIALAIVVVRRRRAHG